MTQQPRARQGGGVVVFARAASRQSQPAVYVAAMRYALAAAVMLATAATAHAAGSVPKLPKGTFYYSARDSLAALGWRPAPLPADQRFCTGGREDVCERYPEASACSGTGLALCRFLWRRGDTLAEVTTYGEEVDMIRVQSVACKAGC